jgi:hypothetical protein
MSFISNHNDSGYTISVSSGYFVNNGGAPQTSSLTVSSEDIYTGLMGFPGVYKFNGGWNNTDNLSWPIFCSSYDVRVLGPGQDDDDGWLVFPGYGIQLYKDDNYDTTNTYTWPSYNTTNKPVVYGCASWDNSGGSWFLYDTNGNYYPENVTTSIRVFYRGTEVTIPSLSS